MENVQTVIAKDLLKIKAVFFRPWEPFTSQRHQEPGLLR